MTAGSDGPRKGDWIQTYAGRQVWPLDPRPEDICIEDIAHALAMQCRFAGHVRCHYSVAEHSVRGLDALCPRNVLTERTFLLHDAAEAYLVDIPRPLKRDLCCAWYGIVEAAWERCIARRFALSVLDFGDSAIKHADNVMLATEARDLMAPPPVPWIAMPEPLPGRIEPWGPQEAERMFLQEFGRLFVGQLPC